MNHGQWLLIGFFRACAGANAGLDLQAGELPGVEGVIGFLHLSLLLFLMWVCLSDRGPFKQTKWTTDRGYFRRSSGGVPARTRVLTFRLARCRALKVSLAFFILVSSFF